MSAENENAAPAASPGIRTRPATLDLDAIERRANNATRGEWENDTEHEDEGTRAIRDFNGPFAWLDETRYDDANFIAHAREDVPALVAEVRRLSVGEVGGLEEQLADALRFALPFADWSPSKMWCEDDEELAALEAKIADARRVLARWDTRYQDTQT